MTYLYLKQSPNQPPSFQASKRPRHFRLAPISRHKKKMAIAFFSLGLIMFFSAILPIIQFQLEYSSKFNQIVSPLSAQFYNAGNILGEVTTDYTQLANWFAPESSVTEAKSLISSGTPTQYTLDIPSLKINDAVVEVGSMDLKKSLIQYPQTALPGQLGNAVIFGHSVLPQFFNPKSYLTIFSTLYKMKIGTEIYINFDNIRYKYLVEDMYETQPTDLTVLQQRFDGRYITLVTCSPPGTYLRRLIIKARIVDI